VRYVDVGNAIALRGNSSFTKNKAIGIGMKVGYSF